ncbi:MAG TPA: ribonuclease HII [Blastocatellia bacterium]|nr:ribonuclease HII [Blastocatellia bacterium]HMY70367.1 ribonuclease HII [Blastocatellia bacterium]HMZ18565.1 ribonuclease HII [Blastocatellia bacterium]HNG28134.1 ribonuclease HII [Blastocatellia bacterium]
MPTIHELLQQSLFSLKASFLDQRAALPKGLLEALEADSRRGARELAARLRLRLEADRAETQRLRHLLKFETELWAQGIAHVAGVDEAGVGPLAGPVVAGAAILPKGYKLRELDDSKKLDETKREQLAEQVKSDAVAWAVGLAEVSEIDSLNIYHAGLLAMRRALEALNIKPDFVLADARTIPNCIAPQRGIVRGDSLSASIAAASILAKTTRDAMMLEFDRQYPGYGLAVHKGYPTPQHIAALRKLGASPIHRRSFRPVREVLGLLPAQAALFNERNR